ncbi:MAG: DUF445 domain-containing protein [Epsilonproteobacteria bacterium]|nr:DUF445 domain-containing protein [Campylobacterota bacterium]
MIFNKIPFLYGSGIIEKNFEKLKSSLEDLIINQFFTKEKIVLFLKEEERLYFDNFLDKIDWDIVFDLIKSSLMSSKLATLLSLVPQDAIDSLKAEFVKKIKNELKNIDEDQKKSIIPINEEEIAQDLVNRVKLLVRNRLEELTPKDVKEIVYKLMREHLGWLVIWGAILGALMGIFSLALLD